MEDRIEGGVVSGPGGDPTLRPTDLLELQDAVRSAEKLEIEGTGHHRMWRNGATGPWSNFQWIPGKAAPRLEMEHFSGIIEWMPSDQVVVVRAGTSLPALQQELDTKGQCLPLVEWYDGYSPLNLVGGTVGGALSINLPGYLEAECGNWRDWVLGLTVVLADGTIVKCGSRVVKNVAGYDLQKLMVGARGSLAVVAEATLRTFPSRSLPKPKCRHHYEAANRPHYWWVQRVPSSDFSELLRNVETLGRIENKPSATVACQLSPKEELPRFAGDWVIRSGCGEKNVEITDPTQIRFMKRAKEVFDPTNKLNPGEWGFM